MKKIYKGWKEATDFCVVRRKKYYRWIKCYHFWVTEFYLNTGLDLNTQVQAQWPRQPKIVEGSEPFFFADEQ